MNQAARFTSRAKNATQDGNFKRANQAARRADKAAKCAFKRDNDN